MAAVPLSDPSLSGSQTCKFQELCFFFTCVQSVISEVLSFQTLSYLLESSKSRFVVNSAGWVLVGCTLVARQVGTEILELGTFSNRWLVYSGLPNSQGERSKEDETGGTHLEI